VRLQLDSAAPPPTDVAQNPPPGSFATTPDAVESALATVYTAVLKQALKEAKVVPTNPPDAITTPSVGRQWIQSNVPDPVEAKAVVDIFQNDSDAAMRKLLAGRYADAAIIKQLLSGEYNLFRMRWPAVFTWTYFFGVIATAGILSLGAPVWFVALKYISSLKPVVARAPVVVTG
jgi:hypothetical protein